MPDRFAKPSRQALWLTTAWTAAGVSLFGLLPLVAPIILLLSVVAPVAWCWAQARRVPWQQPSPAIFALLLAGAYLLINASWSQSPAYAYSFLALFFVFIAVLHVTLCALDGVEAPVLRAMAVGLCIGMAIGSALLCFEILSQQWVARKLMTSFAWLRPNPRDMVMEGGRVIFLHSYLLNRSMTVLALLFWPTVLAIGQLELSAVRRTPLWLGLGLALVAILLSDHATSKIALAGGAAVFFVCTVSRAAATRSTIVAWTAATLLVVPFAALAYTQQLYLARWLPYSAQHRIVIWGYTAEQAIKAPLLGTGVGTTRALSSTRERDGPRAPGSNIELSTGWHSHNGYLQVWYETGAVGAAFLLGIGLLLLQSLARAPPAAQPHLFAAFASGALLAGSSFSIWAQWFVASFGLAAIFASLGARLRASQLAPEDHSRAT